MKNKIKIAVISLCAVGAITAFCSQKSSGKPMDDLLLKNVEALAWGEGGGSSHCLGFGDVDCPFSEVKVRYVMTGYSLEDLY